MRRVVELSGELDAHVFYRQGLAVLTVVHEPEKDADMAKTSIRLCDYDRRCFGYIAYDGEDSDFSDVQGKLFVIGTSQRSAGCIQVSKSIRSAEIESHENNGYQNLSNAHRCLQSTDRQGRVR